MVAIAGGLVGSAMADVTIESFDNFTPNALYASWATPLATITPGPTSWTVSSSTYGSLWKYEGDINGLGNTTVKLSVDISGDPGLIAGPIVDLVDVHGNWGTYAWYGLGAGNYTLTADLSATPWVDLSDIQHIHIECDPSSFQGQYTLTFNDLSLVPEPASLTLLAIGGAAMMILRRRVR